MKSITTELDRIAGDVLTTASHLEGLANNGFGWTKPEASREREGFRAALRENADQLRTLAARVSGKGRTS